MTRSKSLLVAALLVTCGSAHADWVSPSYEQVSDSLTGLLDRVAAARELSPEQSLTAKQLAGAWVAAGPCGMQHITDADGALPIMLNPNPKIGYHAAILEMVAIMIADNLGRKPTDNVCRFATELAGT